MDRFLCFEYTKGTANGVTFRSKNTKGYLCNLVPTELMVGGLSVLALCFLIGALGTDRWIEFDIDVEVSGLSQVPSGQLTTRMGLYRAVNVYDYETTSISLADDDFNGDNNPLVGVNQIPDGGIVVYKW